MNIETNNPRTPNHLNLDTLAGNILGYVRRGELDLDDIESTFQTFEAESTAEGYRSVFSGISQAGELITFAHHRDDDVYGEGMRPINPAHFRVSIGNELRDITVPPELLAPQAVRWKGRENFQALYDMTPAKVTQYLVLIHQDELSPDLDWLRTGFGEKPVYSTDYSKNGTVSLVGDSVQALDFATVNKFLEGQIQSASWSAHHIGRPQVVKSEAEQKAEARVGAQEAIDRADAAAKRARKSLGARALGSRYADRAARRSAKKIMDEFIRTGK